MKYEKCWKLLPVATRLMVAFRLNLEAPFSNRPLKKQECTRRWAWQIFYLDRLLSGGRKEFTSCDEDLMNSRLPCPEGAFNASEEVPMEHPQEDLATLYCPWSPMRIRSDWRISVTTFVTTWAC